MSDETLKLPGLPEPAVIDTHLPTGVRIYGHTADQLRELQRQTVEVCAAICERHNVSYPMSGVPTLSEHIGVGTHSGIHYATALRSLLKDQP